MGRARSTLLVTAIIAATTVSACTAGGSGTAPSTGPANPRSPHTASSNRSPAGASTAANYRAAMSRPLHLPAIRPGQACPTSGGRKVKTGDFTGVAQGAGTVHPVTGKTNGEIDLTSSTQRRGWLAAKSLWFSQPNYQGPFLVRIRRLDGDGPAGVLENPSTPSFYVPAGPTATTINTDGYRLITGATWVKSPGCLAWQVDGLTFSNVIVGKAVCRAPECTMSSLHRARQSSGTS